MIGTHSAFLETKRAFRMKGSLGSLGDEHIVSTAGSERRTETSAKRSGGETNTHWPLPKTLP